MGLVEIVWGSGFPELHTFKAQLPCGYRSEKTRDLLHLGSLT
jgi:hypothetical protein